jgi:hypothetical protein
MQAMAVITQHESGALAVRSSLVTLAGYPGNRIAIG